MEMELRVVGGLPVPSRAVLPRREPSDVCDFSTFSNAGEEAAEGRPLPFV